MKKNEDYNNKNIQIVLWQKKKEKNHKIHLKKEEQKNRVKKPPKQTKSADRLETPPKTTVNRKYCKQYYNDYVLILQLLQNTAVTYCAASGVERSTMKNEQVHVLMLKYIYFKYWNKTYSQ